VEDVKNGNISFEKAYKEAKKRQSDNKSLANYPSYQPANFSTGNSNTTIFG